MQIYNLFLKNGVFCRKEKRMVVLMTFLGGDGCGGHHWDGSCWWRRWLSRKCYASVMRLNEFL